MDKKQIIIYAAAMVFLAFRLYQKYYLKKDKNKSGTAPDSSKDSMVTSSSKEDDYEPYSKK
jgi:hypothetical protein